MVYKVVFDSTKLFRPLSVGAAIEPLRLFLDVGGNGNGNDQRPDICPRNPGGCGKQATLDAAVTRIDNQCRNYEHTN